MGRKRKTLATGAPYTEAAAEQGLASQPPAVVHLRGCLEAPMWPSLAAGEVAELTGATPDTIKALADQGWMPTACFIREGDQFAFRASAVAWYYAFLAVSHATGLLVVTKGGHGVTLDVDMVARPAQAAESRDWLARLTPEMLDASFKIEVLHPGGLGTLLKYELEFAPSIARAAEVWWHWITASFSASLS